jgi:hypothetical protein
MAKRVGSGTNGRAAVALMAAVAGFCEPQTVFAQGGVTIDVADCVKLTSPEERFACYERQVDATGAQKGAAQPAAPPAAAPASPPAPAKAPPATGVAPAAAPAAAAAATAIPAAPPKPATAPATTKTAEPTSPSSNSKGAPPDIEGTIKELRETVPSAYLITLDDGQVWQQTYPEPYFLHAGMRVTLRATKWGSAYRLSAEGQNGFIQVKRVQ